MDDSEKLLIETDQRSRSNQHRIDQLEKKMEDYGNMVTTIKLLAQQQNTMEGDIKEIKGNVKSLTERPARRWESVVNTIINAALCGIVGYLLFKLGLG